MTRESAIKRSIWQFFIAYAIPLILSVRERVVGAPALGTMAIVALVLTIARWVLLTMSLVAIDKTLQHEEQPHAKQSEPGTNWNILRSIQMFQILVIVMPLLLVLSLLATSGKPLYPRAVSAAVNLGVAWLFHQALRVRKSDLQQQNDDPTANTTEQQITVKVDQA
jgi:hypothetical protein